MPERGLVQRAAFAGLMLTAGQAWGRFIGLGAPAGLVFPPEVLAQWLFGVIPMGLFTLGVRALGAGAKWVAFGLTAAVWSLIGGFLLLGVARSADVLSARLGDGPGVRLLCRAGAALAAAALIEGAWMRAGQLVYTGASGGGLGLASWPRLLPLLLGYWAGLSLCARAFSLPEGGGPPRPATWSKSAS